MEKSVTVSDEYPISAPAPPVEQPVADPYGWYAQQQEIEARQRERRRMMLRRMRIVLVGALAAFCLAAWLMVRNDGSLLAWLGISGPSRVVRQHLEALNRGEAREAYGFFSVKYRGVIPLPAYEDMISSHRAMFRTRVLGTQTPSQGEGYAVVDMRLAASSGAHYVARFTLVQIEGRWWIDQVRWSEAPSPGRFTRI